MFIKGHMQNAYVTHDCDRAVEMVANTYGIESWQRLEPDMVVKTQQGDQSLVCRVASAWAGGLNIEIIEPVSGYVEHYANMLPSDRGDATPRALPSYLAATRRRGGDARGNRPARATAGV